MKKSRDNRLIALKVLSRKTDFAPTYTCLKSFYFTFFQKANGQLKDAGPCKKKDYRDFLSSISRKTDFVHNAHLS